MKICFLTHNIRQDNGAGVFSRRLIKGVMDAFGKEAVMALTSAPDGEPYEIPLIRPGIFGIGSELFRIRAAIKTCDVIHALDVFPYGLVAVLTSLGLGKKIIITATGSNSIIPLYSAFRRPLVAWAYAQADRITAISAFTRDEVLKKLPDLKIEILNHGVDADFFARADGSRYDVTGFKPYILGVGQLRWRKGYHFSIRAFAKVRKRFPDIKYVIVGNKFADDYYERLKRVIREERLENSVFILEDVDTREKLADVYRGAELFCLFSQNIGHDVEGFGLVFLEAAAAGLPVVGSRNCGIDDAVRDGENGILVATRSPDDFADAIIAILGNPEKKKAMAAASHVLAGIMTWERQIARYSRLWRELTSRA